MLAKGGWSARPHQWTSEEEGDGWIGSPGKFDVPHFLQPLPTPLPSLLSLRPSCSIHPFCRTVSPTPFRYPSARFPPPVPTQRFAIPSTNEGLPAHRRLDDVAHFVAPILSSRRNRGEEGTTKTMNCRGRGCEREQPRETNIEQSERLPAMVSLATFFCCELVCRWITYLGFRREFHATAVRCISGNNSTAGSSGATLILARNCYRVFVQLRDALMNRAERVDINANIGRYLDFLWLSF